MKIWKNELDYLIDEIYIMINLDKNLNILLPIPPLCCQFPLPGCSLSPEASLRRPLFFPVHPDTGLPYSFDRRMGVIGWSWLQAVEEIIRGPFLAIAGVLIRTYREKKNQSKDNMFIASTGASQETAVVGLSQLHYAPIRGCGRSIFGCGRRTGEAFKASGLRETPE